MQGIGSRKQDTGEENRLKVEGFPKRLQVAG